MKQSLPILFVLTRTSHRPQLFHLQSISLELLGNIPLYHFVSYDNLTTLQYLSSHPNSFLIRHIIPIQNGYARLHKGHFPYNLYQNILLNHVISFTSNWSKEDQSRVWILFLDDDNFVYPILYSRLVEQIERNPQAQLIIWRLKHPNLGIIPPDNIFREKEIISGKIDTNCFMTRLTHIQRTVSRKTIPLWDDRKGSDFRCLLRLTRTIPTMRQHILWVNQIWTECFGVSRGGSEHMYFQLTERIDDKINQLLEKIEISSLSWHEHLRYSLLTKQRDTNTIPWIKENLTQFMYIWSMLDPSNYTRQYHRRIHIMNPSNETKDIIMDSSHENAEERVEEWDEEYLEEEVGQETNHNHRIISSDILEENENEKGDKNEKQESLSFVPYNEFDAFRSELNQTITSLQQNIKDIGEQIKNIQLSTIPTNTNTNTNKKQVRFDTTNTTTSTIGLEHGIKNNSSPSSNKPTEKSGWNKFFDTFGKIFLLSSTSSQRKQSTSTIQSYFQKNSFPITLLKKPNTSCNDHERICRMTMNGLKQYIEWIQGEPSEQFKQIIPPVLFLYDDCQIHCQISERFVSMVQDIKEDWDIIFLGTITKYNQLTKRNSFPESLFDASFYEDEYKDIKQKKFTNGQMYKHFKQYGLREGRHGRLSMERLTKETIHDNVTGFIINGHSLYKVNEWIKQRLDSKEQRSRRFFHDIIQEFSVMECYPNLIIRSLKHERDARIFRWYLPNYTSYKK